MADVDREILEQTLAGSQEPVMVVRTDQPDWPVALVNPAFHAIGGDDAGAPAGEPNGRVSGPTPQIKDSLTGHVAEQAPVDLGTDTWSELDMVERSGSRCSVFVAHHACTLGRSDQNDG